MTDAWQIVGKERGPNISFIIDYSIELEKLSNQDDYPFEQTQETIFTYRDITNNSSTIDCLQTERLQSHYNSNIYNIRIISHDWISILDIKNNRLELLTLFCKTFNRLIDFSKIESA